MNSEHLHPEGRPFTKDEFVEKIKTDDEFANKWGNLGKIYGFQWRNWGGWTDTKQTGFLHKTDNGWSVKWSDLHSFANGTEWMTTPIQDSDQSLYGDEDEGRKVYYKNITLGYDKKSFSPIQVAKVIDDKFDKYVGGIDQISELIRLLKETPDSRRMVVNAWAVHDLPNMVLPPCHYGFQVYTRELSLEERSFIAGSNHSEVSQNIKMFTGINEDNTLHKHLDNINTPTRAISLMYNARSQDVPLGTPFNLASYGLLLEIIAKEVNMVPDELITNMGDCHIYLNQIDGVKEQIGRDFSLEERNEIHKNLAQHMRYRIDKLDLLKKIDYSGGLITHEILDELDVPKRKRQPFPLPKLVINDEFWNQDDSIFNQIEHITPEDFFMENYQSHPTIKIPLSN